MQIDGVAVLVRAAELIKDKGWVQNWDARDYRWRVTVPEEKYANWFSAKGAIRRAYMDLTGTCAPKWHEEHSETEHALVIDPMRAVVLMGGFGYFMKYRDILSTYNTLEDWNNWEGRDKADVLYTFGEAEHILRVGYDLNLLHIGCRRFRSDSRGRPLRGRALAH